MIGALLRYVVGNRLPLLIGSVVVTVLVLLTGWLLPFAGFCGLWSLVLIAGLVHASVHDTGDGAE